MKPRFHVMLLVMLAGWVNRHQQDMIDYLKEENKILREKLGKKRLLLNDDQRRRLAVLAHKLGRKALEGISEVFSPDTLLRWHRTLIARKYGIRCSLPIPSTRQSLLDNSRRFSIIPGCLDMCVRSGRWYLFQLKCSADGL